MSRFRTTAPLAAVAAAATAVVLAVSGRAGANNTSKPHAVPAPPANPTRADQIQNIDQVKTAIKAYYGDTVSGKNPDGSDQHLASPKSAYAKEMASVAGYAQSYLGKQAKQHKFDGRKPAIVLDVDDTSLNTYNYEIFSSFVYNPTTNGQFVDAQAFPAVFHMVDLVKYAKSKGYAIFFLTGRPEAQRKATEGNLTKVGYPAVPDNQVYLKDQTKAWLTSCAPSCTTVQYKSLTRKHIGSLGYKVVANFGDQYSDLAGGYSRASFKLPNPMYFLP